MIHQLAIKDRQLILAAKCGKVLLEEKDELERQIEILNRDYQQRIDVKRKKPFIFIIFIFLENRNLNKNAMNYVYFLNKFKVNVKQKSSNQMKINVKSLVNLMIYVVNNESMMNNKCKQFKN